MLDEHKQRYNKNVMIESMFCLLILITNLPLELMDEEGKRLLKLILSV